MWNTYGMGEINPIISTSCEKMTGTRVHHVEHSKKSRDPSIEHLRLKIKRKKFTDKETYSEHISRVFFGWNWLSSFLEKEMKLWKSLETDRETDRETYKRINFPCFCKI